MTFIKNQAAYIVKSPLSLNDFAIGTSAESATSQNIAQNQTISIKLQDMRDLFLAGLSPIIGGVLKITELEYSGVLTSVVDVANALTPAYEVQAYEVLILNVNGNRYLFNEQDVTIGLGQTAVDAGDFITIFSVENVGTGTAIFKGYSNDVAQFRVVTSTGFDITVVGANAVNFEKKAGVNLGDGIAIYKGLNAATKVDEFYKLISDDISIVLDGNDVRLTLPTSASIPQLNVNDAYIPTYDEWNTYKTGSTYKGSGTLARPYTNTITYTDPNTPVITADTAIQNGLDAYVGSGTRLNPEKLGQEVVIQDNAAGYTFAGDFNYSGLNIQIYASITSTVSTKIIDMDNATYFNATNAAVIVTLNNDSVLNIQGTGMFNSGNSDAGSTFATGRTISLLGEGIVYSAQSDISRYIINSDTSNSGNNNDGNLTFTIKCRIWCDAQGVYSVGGVSRIDIYNELRSGTLANSVTVSLKAFHQTGGQVRLFTGASTNVFGGTRTDAVTFTPTGGFTPVYISVNSQISGAATNLFTKTNTGATTLQVTNSPSGYSLTITNVFASPNLWEVYFKNNVLASGSIDTAVADLTGGNSYSASNVIGDNIIESLVIYASRALAVTAGRPKGTAFINRKTVATADLVDGTEYSINTLGSTNFTAVGAASNTVGLNFTCVGSTTGSGTAFSHTRDVLI